MCTWDSCDPQTYCQVDIPRSITRQSSFCSNLKDETILDDPEHIQPSRVVLSVGQSCAGDCTGNITFNVVGSCLSVYAQIQEPLSCDEACTIGRTCVQLGTDSGPCRTQGLSGWVSDGHFMVRTCQELADEQRPDTSKPAAYECVAATEPGGPARLMADGSFVEDDRDASFYCQDSAAAPRQSLPPLAASALGLGCSLALLSRRQRG